MKAKVCAWVFGAVLLGGIIAAVAAFGVPLAMDRQEMVERGE